MKTETVRRASWAIYIPPVILGLLVLQPLPYAGALNGIEYFRVGLITVGLGYLLWRYQLRDTREATDPLSMAFVLMALVLIFIVNQFNQNDITNDNALGMLVPRWVPVFLIIIAFVVSLWNGQLRGLVGWLDWVVIGLGTILVGVSMGSSLMFGYGIAWYVQVKIAASVLLWFVATRTGAAVPELSRKLAIEVLGVLAIVSLIGLIQVGAIFSYSQKGKAAHKGGELENAAENYRKALAFSKRLELDDISFHTAFKLAGVLFEQGKKDRAAEALALEKGFIKVVPADAWNGPEGGNLFYPISCWKDLIFYEGEAEIRIFAHGTPALDIWPRMEVKLGDKLIDYVSVVSRESQPYSFSVYVKETGLQRLKISFLNDVHQLDPYFDRNLVIDQAEIHFGKIPWE
jgi:hypothetical protein